jgi:hypothetical protein
MEGMRKCVRCELLKPLNCFSSYKKASGEIQPHSYCKPCRSAYNTERNQVRGRKDRSKRRPVVEELWPRKLTEVLLDRASRRWRGPVRHKQLTPIIEVRYDEAA